MGLTGRLDVGLRIMPPWIGLFMALVVVAQVTLTAAPWAPQSPDGNVGRGVLLLIIPIKNRHTKRLNCALKRALDSALDSVLHREIKSYFI